MTSLAPRINRPFSAQAALYDVIYKHKPYARETKQILKLFEELDIPVRKALSIGSGTCSYELEFAKHGIDVCAVERSPEMIEQARLRLRNDPAAAKIRLCQGDGAAVSLNEKFDVVLLLFCVVNYCESPEHLARLLSNCSKHLKPGGSVIFDSWYKPAVIHSPPQPRESVICTDLSTYIRTATPHPLNDLGSYLIRYGFHRDSSRNNEASISHDDEILEEHHIRAFDANEVEQCASLAGMVPSAQFTWPTLAPLSTDSWTALWILRQEKP